MLCQTVRVVAASGCGSLDAGTVGASIFLLAVHLRLGLPRLLAAVGEILTVGGILTLGLLGGLPWVLRLSPMAETSTRLLGLAELCQTVGIGGWGLRVFRLRRMRVCLRLGC
jgi:hypothetical protein